MEPGRLEGHPSDPSHISVASMASRYMLSILNQVYVYLCMPFVVGAECKQFACTCIS